MKIFCKNAKIGKLISRTSNNYSENFILEDRILDFLLNKEDSQYIRWEERKERRAERLHYNAADMLGMRYYDIRAEKPKEELGNFYPWPKCEGEELVSFIRKWKNHSIHFPETIVYYFYSHSIEELIVAFPCHYILKQSVENYIQEQSLDMSDMINRHLNTLTVHLRIGDFGDLRENFINKFKELLKDYENCIILLGLHITPCGNTDDIISSYINAITNCLQMSDKIKISVASADEHLCMMFEASNLLVHRGGFSLLGMILCKGKVFYTEEMKDRMNKKFMNEIGDKNITLI